MKHIVSAIIFLTCLFVSICIGSKEANSPVLTLEVLRSTTEWTPSKIRNMISRVSYLYDYPEKSLNSLALAESSFRHNVVGDGGFAYGLYQYHKLTWISFTKKYGLEGFNIKDPVDQTVTTIEALKDNQHCHWTPLRKSNNCL